MSEYQYDVFQAIDRPLSGREMSRLPACSTRATITPTRFVNHYEWGSFKGDAVGWMEKYFDAFVYVANSGTHESHHDCCGDGCWPPDDAPTTIRGE